MIVHFERDGDRRGPHKIVVGHSIALTERYPGLPERETLEVIYEGTSVEGEPMIAIRIRTTADGAGASLN